MILVFTNKEDAHPNPVFDRLKERGVPFFRLNTEDLLTDYTFSWWASAAGCDFVIRNIQSGLEVMGSEITSVWDRRPEPPKSLPLKNTDKIDSHNLREALAFLRFLRHYVEHIPSVGSIVGDKVASSKMLQYRTAIECGFSVPETVYANNKAAVLELAVRHEHLYLKSIDGLDVWDDENGVDYVFYTRTLEAKELDTIPDEAFLQTVSFVQEYVPKAYELRVTVVGDKVFATKIHSQNLPEDKGKVDWRQGYDSGLSLEVCDLPKEVADRCLTLVRALGLNFGCIDLIVKPDGGYVFLECNPNGQWLWIELATGQPIAGSIADFLIRPVTDYEPQY